MMEKLRAQKPIYTILIAVIIATIPCYCLGFVALAIRPSPLTPTPIPETTETAVPNASATPYEVGPGTGTPSKTLQPTPTQWFPPTRTPTPTATETPLPSMTPTDTPTPTPTPLPPAEIKLNGADFDAIMPNRIPGWKWDAYVNYRPDSDYDSENSYAEPVFTIADDPQRQIDGATLKVETIRWLKFRTWVHQTVTVTAGSRAYFQIKAKAYSSLDGLIVRTGIDPTGAENCYTARWGKEMRINQDSGTVKLSSPNVIVGSYQDPTVTDETEEEENEEAALGRVTLCFYAEPTFPHINNAAFFDQAVLVVAPPR